jgi:hypothetical protein
MIYYSAEIAIQINILEFWKIKWTLEASGELKKQKAYTLCFILGKCVVKYLVVFICI